MNSFTKKISTLALLALVSAVSASADFTCRLTLARSGNGLHSTKGVVNLRGVIGERVTGLDEGTGFKYRIEVRDGGEVNCRGIRRQAVVSLSDRSRPPFIKASTCFDPREDFLIGSASADHWIYFNCYNDDRR